MLQTLTKGWLFSHPILLPLRLLPFSGYGAAKRNSETSTCIGTTKINEQADESSCLPSVTDVKGLLQITEVELLSNENSEKMLALCDSAYIHSWISARLARKLKVRGVPTKLTLHGINSHQVVETQMVELKLTPIHSGGSFSPFERKPFRRYRHYRH